jgi:hypothetical protein
LKCNHTSVGTGILNSANRYSFLFRIQTAKRAKTCAKRIGQFAGMLERGEKFHQKQTMWLLINREDNGVQDLGHCDDCEYR